MGEEKPKKNTGISPQTLEHKTLISNLMIPNLGKRNWKLETLTSQCFFGQYDQEQHIESDWRSSTRGEAANQIDQANQRGEERRDKTLMTIVSEACKKKKKTKQNQKSKALANLNNKTWIVRIIIIIIIIEGARFPWPQSETLKTGNFFVAKPKKPWIKIFPK